MAEGGLHDQALAAVILVGGAGQAVAHRRPDPLVDQARSVEAAQVGQHLAGQAQVAHRYAGPALQRHDVTSNGHAPGARPNRSAVAITSGLGSVGCL